MPRRTIRQGESIESIAAQAGLLPETIWEHSDNQGMRELRASPSVLAPGDELFIPELTQKTVSLPTTQVHTITRKAIPARFRVKFMQDGEPRASASYLLSVDGGEPREGQTDADGLVDEPVSPCARQVTIEFIDDDHEEPDDEYLQPIIAPAGDSQRRRVYRLRALDPSATVAGAQARLQTRPSY